MGYAYIVIDIVNKVMISLILEINRGWMGVSWIY